MGALGKSLRETLKKLSYQTSVEQLKKRGVKNVNVVGLDRVVALMEEAVHRSLRNKLAGLERDEVAGATREEFLKLLRNQEDLARSRDEAVQARQRAEEELDELRRQLEARRQELRERLAAGEHELRASQEGEDAEIVRQVDEVFSALAESSEAGLPELRDRMVEMVMSVLQRQRAATMEARQAVRDREVELLQRRISKLNTALQDSELRLGRLARLKDVDAGISSIYREVQGLSDEDGQYQRKKELMTDIFEANLALQKGANT